MELYMFEIFKNNPSTLNIEIKKIVPQLLQKQINYLLV